MRVTGINTVNLYRIQGNNSKISRKRIIYKEKTAEVNILFRDTNIYLSINNAHHYYFMMKQVSKLMRAIAKENNDDYCREFKNNILELPQREHYIDALEDAKIQSVKLEIPQFVYNYISKFASYNMVFGNTLKMPEFCDTSKLGGAISSVREWNQLIELLTLKVSVKELGRKEIVEVLKTIPNYHNYIFGYDSFSFDYDEKRNEQLYRENTQVKIKELLHSIYQNPDCKGIRDNEKADINNFMQSYKKLVKRP